MAGQTVGRAAYRRPSPDLGAYLVVLADKPGRGANPWQLAHLARWLQRQAVYRRCRRQISRWLSESDEVHEALANAALALVGGHLAWLLGFNRRLAWALVRGSAPTQAASTAWSSPQAARPPLAAPTRMSLQVTLDGHTHQLPVAAGEVLLQAMEHHGLQPPSACRSGACGACKCRVTSGQVRLRENGALSTAELAEGWTLAYQAEAVSAKVTVQY